MLCLERNTALETLPPVHYAVPYWEHIHKDMRDWTGQILPRERSALCNVSLRYMRLRCLLEACHESTRANWAQRFQQLVLENDVVVSGMRQSALRACVAYLSHHQCPVKITGQTATLCNRDLVQRAIDWEHGTLMPKSNTLSVFWNHVPTGSGDPLHFEGFCEKADGAGVGNGQNAMEIKYTIVSPEADAHDVIQKCLLTLGPSAHPWLQNSGVHSLSPANYTVKIKPLDSGQEILHARPFTSIDRNFGEPVNVYMFRPKACSDMHRKVCAAIGVDLGGVAMAVHDKFLQFFERSERGLCKGEC
jgi:hypothetical protein